MLLGVDLIFGFGMTLSSLKLSKLILLPIIVRHPDIGRRGHEIFTVRQV